MIRNNNETKIKFKSQYTSIYCVFRSKVCLPYLKKGKNPHILNLSPPLNMKPNWFKNHVAYTMAKYGMSMCVLGMSEEFKDDGIAVNALWPRTGENIYKNIFLIMLYV